MLMVSHLVGFGASSPGIGGNDSFTKLLLHCDGVDGSTTFADESIGGANGTATVNGNAQVDTAQSVFGEGSLLCDGFGDSLEYASDSDWDFGTGDFTIDFRLRFAAASNFGLMSHIAPGGTTGWAFRYLNGTGIRFLTTSGVATDRAWSPSLNTWYHIAFVRAAGVIRIFVDGTKLGADISDSSDLSNAGQTLLIGNSHFVGESLNGWMDEIRISNGVARWTSDFTPPAGAYTV